MGFSIGFSGHACGNPLRYVPKAPPEPENVESITGAGSLSLAPGLDPERPTAEILPIDGFLNGTPANLRLSNDHSRKEDATIITSDRSDGSLVA